MPLSAVTLDLLKPIRYPLMWTYSFLRTRSPFWDLLNRSSKALYSEHPPNLDQLQQTVANGLVENGIGFVHLDEIFPGENLFSDLMGHVSLQEEEAKVGTTKPFLQYHWGSYLDHHLKTPLMIDLDNPFIRFSLYSRILDIVNSYMRTCSKLILFELATANLMRPGMPPMKSQRWHRDPGMKRIVKVFIYLSEVDEESGPFTYLLKSHSGGRWRSLFRQKQFGRHGIYPPDGAVEKAVPKNEIKVCTGRAGTVIFCDTTGLHKGGYNISQPRIMFTAVYVAEGDLIKPKFKHPADFKERVNTLSAVSQFAVT